MKQIKNWDKATVCDIETDGFLDVVSKIHIVGLQLHGKDNVNFIKGDNLEKIKSMLKYHIDNEIPIVGHNFVMYDVPVFEKILKMDLSNLMVIDTLALSWYLNTDHKSHSIESLSKDYDTHVQKYFVDPDDWSNLAWEDAVNRVESDVILNSIIWEDFKARLTDMYTLAKENIDDGVVGGSRVSPDEKIYIDSLVGLSLDEHINRILTFLMFKMDVIRLQEKTGWHVDVPYLEKSISDLEILLDKSATELEKIMDSVPTYSERKEPARPFKKNGDLSATGENWARLKKLYDDGVIDDNGNSVVIIKKQGCFHELTSYKKPNINSHQQVKDFLFKHGWIPCTFKMVRDKEAFNDWINSKPTEGSPHSAWTAWKNARPEDRAVPQVRKDGDDGKELVESVLELAEKVPEIEVLEEYSTIKHRYDTLNGILERVVDGKVQASAHGFTNTLRLKHRAPIVNLPSADKKYAEPIRGCLVSLKGYVLTGSDLSSLEDRVKIHYMFPLDPTYAMAMSDPKFDPHIATAVAMGEITEKQGDDYINGKLVGEELTFVKIKRGLAKPVNYLSVYGGTYKALMIQTGWEEGRCKEAIEAYWNLNWSVKKIAEEQVVIKDSRGNQWLINPVNGFLYSVRSEKDYFSTLAQGSGSFFFDMWVDKVLTKQRENWGGQTLTANMHDEVVVCTRDNPKWTNQLSLFLTDSIKEVSDEYLLRRELGCEVQTGYRYSEIH